MARTRNLDITVTNDRNLPEAIATKYDLLTNHSAGVYHYKGHKVHLDRSV
ncbi:hypothetical protein [Pedobacter sp. NJ-S-72]